MGCCYDDFIAGLRCHISDPDAEIWKRCSFETYINSAYSELASVRPDAFSEEITVKFEGGKCRQVIDCECVLGVISVNGHDCDTPEQLDQRISGANSYLEKCFSSTCGLSSLNDMVKPPIADYNPESYAIDSKSARAVVLSEAPPCDVEAVVCCVPKWKLDCDGEIPEALCGGGSLNPGFIQLILHLAYAADHDSLTNIELSKLHFESYQAWLSNSLAMQFSKRQPDYSYGRRITAQ